MSVLLTLGFPTDCSSERVFLLLDWRSAGAVSDKAQKGKNSTINQLSLMFGSVVGLSDRIDVCP